MRALIHQSVVDVYELAHTTRGMGTTQAWLEKRVAVDAKMDLHSKYVAVQLYGPSLMRYICEDP